MNCLPRRGFAPLPLKRYLLTAIGIVALCLTVSSLGAAQEATATLSGRVLYVNGNPIAGLPIAVQYVEISHNVVWLTYIMLEEDEHVLEAYVALPKSITDDLGRFFFSRNYARSHPVHRATCPSSA